MPANQVRLPQEPASPKEQARRARRRGAAQLPSEDKPATAVRGSGAAQLPSDTVFRKPLAASRSKASSPLGPCEARQAQQQPEEVVLPLLAPAGLEIKGGAGVENRGQWWPDQRYVQRRFFGYT